MLKKFLLKLKKRNGESLSEALIALLIGCLGMVLLATAIMASTKIITQNKRSMDHYRMGENEMLLHGDGISGEVHIIEELGNKPMILHEDGADTISVTYKENVSTSHTPVVLFERENP